MFKDLKIIKLAYGSGVKVRRRYALVLILISTFAFPINIPANALTTAPQIAQALTLGCSKAQADAQEAGSVTSQSIQGESRYVKMSMYTKAYQEYLFANKFANAWKKIVSKSPKCFRDQIPTIEPIFKKFYSKASMCQRYGNAICKVYPSKLAPRKPLTLADICGRNPSSASYLECVERLGEPDGPGYAD